MREFLSNETLTASAGDSFNDYRDLLCVVARNYAFRKKSNEIAETRATE